MSKCNSGELTYYQRNRDVILNRANYYCENDKERLKGKARDQYRNSSKAEKKWKETIWKKLIPKYVWRKKKQTKRVSKKISRG